MNYCGAPREDLIINQFPQAYNCPLKCSGVIYEGNKLIIDNQISTSGRL